MLGGAERRVGRPMTPTPGVAGITASIPVGRRPWGIALTPDGRKLYTANGVSNDVSVIDTSQGKVAIRVGEGPWGVAIWPDASSGSWQLSTLTAQSGACATRESPHRRTVAS
jgi:YVTN family beta-propeller protein